MEIAHDAPIGARSDGKVSAGGPNGLLGSVMEGVEFEVTFTVDNNDT